MKPILDISEWQVVSDYQKVADQVSGVILRCSATGYGDSHSVFDDSRFEEHYRGFIKTGIPIGAYHYAGAVTESGVDAEIHMTQAMLKDKKITLPVFYDVEEVHGQYFSMATDYRTKLAQRYLDGIVALGYKPGLYTYLGYKNMLYLHQFSCPIWMAQYYKELQYNGRCEIWQYTSSGYIDGISYIDRWTDESGITHEDKSGLVDLSKVQNESWWKSLVNKAEETDIILPSKPDPISKEYVDMQIAVLRHGDEGNLVKALQGILEANGFDLQYCGGCDGIFGDGTEYAVKAYQQEYGLDVDGIVGEETWGSMLSEY